MFFHFSALQGGPEAFSVGNDVEFSVTREPKGERLNAVEYAVLFTVPASVLTDYSGLVMLPDTVSLPCTGQQQQQ